MLGHVVTLKLKLLRDCYSVFLRGCPIVRSHQPFVRILIFLRLHQYLLVSVFLIRAILGG